MPKKPLTKKERSCLRCGAEKTNGEGCSAWGEHYNRHLYPMIKKKKIVKQVWEIDEKTSWLTRIELSIEGRMALVGLPVTRKKRAYLTGHSRDGKYVMVLLDGNRQSTQYAKQFWKLFTYHLPS